MRQSIDLRKEKEKEEANPPGGREVLIWDTRHHDEDEKINLVVRVSLGPGRGTTNGRYAAGAVHTRHQSWNKQARGTARRMGQGLASIQPWDWRKSCAHGRDTYG